MRLAAKAGHLEALHEAGLVYHTGFGGVEQDKRKAAQIFKASAEKGHPASKRFYGLDLFYGSCGIEKDESLGKELRIGYGHDGFDHTATDRVSP